MYLLFKPVSACSIFGFDAWLFHHKASLSKHASPFYWSQQLIWSIYIILAVQVIASSLCIWKYRRWWLSLDAGRPSQHSVWEYCTMSVVYASLTKQSGIIRAGSSQIWFMSVFLYFGVVWFLPRPDCLANYFISDQRGYFNSNCFTLIYQFKCVLPPRVKPWVPSW